MERAGRMAWGIVLGIGFATGLAIAQFSSPGDPDAWAADEALRARVDRSIALHRALHPFDIGVEVVDGAVLLRGSVDDPMERELASRLARATDGVRRVDNRLVVEPDRARWLGQHTAMAGAGMDDRALALAVRSQLRWNMATRAMPLDVDSWRGHLVLRGNALTLREREAAGRIAARIEGVLSVDNRIRVEAPASQRHLATLGPAGTAFSDAWIMTKVKSGLLFTPHTSGLDLQVAVRNGEVELAGLVANRTELDLALEIVAAIRGVHRIDISGVRCSA
jgi:osmotically-inducible protein OsmY